MADQDTLEGETVNISAGGLCVSSEEPLRLNEIYRLSVLPPNSKPLEVKGKVVWSDLYGLDNDNATICFGICLVEISDEDRHYIEEIVLDNLVKEKEEQYEITDKIQFKKIIITEAVQEGKKVPKAAIYTALIAFVILGFIFFSNINKNQIEKSTPKEPPIQEARAKLGSKKSSPLSLPEESFEYTSKAEKGVDQYRVETDDFEEKEQDTQKKEVSAETAEKLDKRVEEHKKIKSKEEQLYKRRHALNEEYQTFLKEREQVNNEVASLKTPEEIRIHNSKAAELEKKIEDYNQKRKTLDMEIEEHNSRAKEFLNMWHMSE